METQAHFENRVLRVLFDLARDRVPADAEQLLLRLGRKTAPLPLLSSTLRLLERAQLVEFLSDGCMRLTMTGFALAVAGPLPAPRRPTALNAAPPAPSAGEAPPRALHRAKSVAA